MVNFQQLNSAQPGLWASAATDWAELSADIQARSGELSRGTGDPLKDGWKGAAAETARGRISQSVHGMQAAAVEVAVIGEILKGLGESLRLAQGMLNDGKDLAAKAGLQIDANGKITVPSGKANSQQAKQAVALIRQAIKEATTIDAEAARWLNQKARDKIGSLNGIPDGVKAEIAGSNGLDRIALIRFAIKNWSNGGIDTPGDNCTTFVSQALREAGLNENGDWQSAAITGIDGIDPHTRTDAWAAAGSLHQFLTQNDDAANISPSQTRPGDILFFRDSAEGIHHAAVVTAVLDGHIYYTQHSNPAQNTDWSYRSTVYGETGDAQTPIIVRPKQNPSMPYPREPR